MGGDGDILAGGDMFGFEIVYTQGPESMMILVSNNGGALQTHSSLILRR